MTASQLILAIDRNQRNLELLGQFLQKEGYESVSASTQEEIDTVLDQSDNIALALVDIAGFDARIWQSCEQLRDKGVPLLVLSARQSAAIQQESLVHGARGVLVKPLVVKELISLVRSLIVE
jgi:DNA-binding response OmpR family regulator